MNKLPIKSKLPYLVLIIFLSLIIFLFFTAAYEVAYQRYLILLLVVFYFFWGIVTQHKAGRLTKKLILEYLGISFLAALLLFLITL